jgi:hypothetical protein
VGAQAQGQRAVTVGDVLFDSSALKAFSGVTFGESSTDGPLCQLRCSRLGRDAAGNLSHISGQVEQSVGAAWDTAGRMRVFFDARPSCSGTSWECGSPVEESAYDASGYRVVHIDARGRPVISLRQGDGQVQAEYTVHNAGSSAQLARHLLYGAGQFLVERPEVIVPRDCCSDHAR